MYNRILFISLIESSSNTDFNSERYRNISGTASHMKMGEKGFSENEGSKQNLVHLDIGAVLLRFVITSKFSEI